MAHRALAISAAERGGWDNSIPQLYDWRVTEGIVL